MATKERRIFSVMESDVDAVVLMNGGEPNIDTAFFYATGIPNGLFEECLAIVRPDRMEVLSSTLEETSARSAGIRTSVFDDSDGRMKLAQKKLRGFKRIGVNHEDLTVKNYNFIKKAAQGAKLVDVSEDLFNARVVKQPDEIDLIEKACLIASKAGEEIPEIVHEGQTDTGAAAELNRKMMIMGATGPAFVSGIAFGPDTAEPHYQPQGRKLKRGQLALFDFGAAYRRYVSDVTRTFICGKPSVRQNEMYDIVLKAQLAAIDAIHDGVHGKDVDRAARDIIDRSKFRGLFIHSTGHGIGISVHDPGRISSSKDMVIKKDMVLTVEPGVYVPGFGGVRIEDDILVTKDGCKVLTPCTKEFRTV